jgi:translation initiation factor 6
MFILTTNLNGNPNIGLYGYVTDKFCLLGLDVPLHTAKQIGSVLKVPVHQLNICGTSMLGAFLSGNDNCILVPSIAFESELKHLDKLNIPYKVIKTELTALGNNILCNNDGCAVNPGFPADVQKQISKALGVKVFPMTIAGVETVGSVACINKHGCAIHSDANEHEIHKLKEILKVNVDTTTVNLGNPFIGSCVLCNSNGIVIGDRSSGPELGNLEQVLGFLKQD